MADAKTHTSYVRYHGRVGTEGAGTLCMIRDIMFLGPNATEPAEDAQQPLYPWTERADCTMTHREQSPALYDSTVLQY